LLDPTTARIVSGKGQDEGTAVVLEQGGDLGGTHLGASKFESDLPG
jgi:hypothetical protein